MQHGLEGRRIALFGDEGDALTEIRKELIASGALVQELSSEGDEQEWHGGKYAGLVLVGPAAGRQSEHAKVAQLVREFMVSEKPVAAFGIDAGAFQLDETLLAVKGGGDARAFAADVVREFAECLEEHDLDDMSDQSFPASDPPAVNPGSAGPVSPEPGARP